MKYLSLRRRTLEKSMVYVWILTGILLYIVYLTGGFDTLP